MTDVEAAAAPDSCAEGEPPLGGRTWPLLCSPLAAGAAAMTARGRGEQGENGASRRGKRGTML